MMYSLLKMFSVIYFRPYFVIITLSVCRISRTSKLAAVYHLTFFMFRCALSKFASKLVDVMKQIFVFSGRCLSRAF